MSALTRPPDTRRTAEPVLEWPSLNRPAFRGPAFAVSVALHAVGVVALVLLAREAAAPVESSVRGFRSSTVLVAPPMELTQTAPNPRTRA